jgi:hypothetical protein
MGTDDKKRRLSDTINHRMDKVKSKLLLHKTEMESSIPVCQFCEEDVQDSDIVVNNTCTFGCGCMVHGTCLLDNSVSENKILWCTVSTHEPSHENMQHSKYYVKTTVPVVLENLIKQAEKVIDDSSGMHDALCKGQVDVHTLRDM